MIKLSKMTDYSVVILAEMARGQGALMTASGLAVASNLPEPTVAKVLKLLARGAVISSVRGANGGYVLERPPEEISIASVIVALEGPVVLTDCVTSGGGCCHEKTCAVKGQWDPVNDAMRIALENVTLAQMMTRQA
jgi:FeS assembly SUF system regulator